MSLSPSRFAHHERVRAFAVEGPEGDLGVVEVRRLGDTGSYVSVKRWVDLDGSKGRSHVASAPETPTRRRIGDE